MIRRPPRSTRTDPLFPQTTSFRSEQIQGSQSDQLAGSRVAIPAHLAEPVALVARDPDHRRHLRRERTGQRRHPVRRPGDLVRPRVDSVTLTITNNADGSVTEIIVPLLQDS